jgi:dTDP-glucose pyrophosphorylase
MISVQDIVAVIPAAGRPHGTWSGLHTASCDAMFPIAGKPAIYWTLQDLFALGIKRVSIVVRERGNDLEQFVRTIFCNKFELHFVQPDRLLGVGYSVQVGASMFPAASPLLVILGDTISHFAEVKVEFTKSTVYIAQVSDYSRWCMATVDQGRVLALHDKPEASFDTVWALTGIYYFSDGRQAFSDAVVAQAESGQRVEMSHLLAELVARGALDAYPDALWLDVGNPDHVYDAQSRLIQSRSFNRLQVDQVRGTITKKSTYQLKFFDEIKYYKLLPEKLQIFFPRVVSSSTQAGNLELTLEFYAYPSLADLYLFADLSPHLWRRIFLQLRAICRVFTADNYGTDADASGEIYLKKNRDRLEAFLRQPPVIALPFVRSANPRVNGRFVPSLAEAYAKSEPALRQLAANAKLSVFHGDLCFSNILCEPARGLIKLIDPRGGFGRQGVLGDFRYDIAKLTHSVIGLYDWIVNDLCEVTVHPSGDVDLSFPVQAGHQKVQDSFAEVFFADYPQEEISLITAWLFLSMLPLHADSPKRQVAMAARGLELLANLKL